MRMVVICLALLAPIAASVQQSPPPVPMPPFSFGPAFGTHMVLQMAPAKSAVYGYLGTGATAVKVTVSSGGKDLYSVDATVDATLHQPFGPDWGVKTFNAYNRSVPGWKALLNPTEAGGEYTITAVCTGCAVNATQTISDVTFGDVWLCSGQSNMWLPVANSFSRNDTVAAIGAGKFSNVRMMAGNSGTSVYADKSGRVNTAVDYGDGTCTEVPGRYNSTKVECSSSNPWMSAKEAVAVGHSSAKTGGDYPLFTVGAACWYFAARLSELGVDTPIGIANTAIGGQRIEEYMVNTTEVIGKCSQRSGETPAGAPWDGRHFGDMISPFLDMTLKGWAWYQGENNMGATKGNSDAGIGYSCEQRELVRGWRNVWSETAGTTDPNAPFGIVTLADSGGEGSVGMGPMHLAQTAGLGHLPGPAGSGMENTFLAQAYDLDDEWMGGGVLGPCFREGYNGSFQGTTPSPHHNCCGGKENFNTSQPHSCTPEWQAKCSIACEGTSSTPTKGGIHPRNKKLVGDRLGQACFNTVYGGQKSYTGPTLSGCALTPTTLTIKFNNTLLRGDAVRLQKFGASVYTPYHPGFGNPSWNGGSMLWVQVNASNFCIETQLVNASDPFSDVYCPIWAGGKGTTDARPGNTRTIGCRASPHCKASPDCRKDPACAVVRGMRFHNGTCAAAGFDAVACKDWTQTPEQFQFDQAWINLPTMAVGTAPGTIIADISQLAGQVPTAIRYAWGWTNCCDLEDSTLGVTHGCVANCPIMSESGLPANPFIAKINNGKCECVPPMVCGA